MQASAKLRRISHAARRAMQDMHGLINYAAIRAWSYVAAAFFTTSAVTTAVAATAVATLSPFTLTPFTLTPLTLAS
jgi:hypothetical protein